MKSLPVLSLALIALGCQQQGQQDAAEIELSKVSFEIPNMVCEFSCVPTVEKTLAMQPGVEKVEVDLKTKTAVVTVKADQFDADAAIAALVDVQFIDTKLKSSAASASPEDATTAAVVRNTSG